MSGTGRLAWTLATGLILGSLFGIYARVVTPLLAVPVRATRVRPLDGQAPSGPPPENARWAREYLPAWAETARWQGRWGDSYFFAGQQEAMAEAGAVRCAPFAIVHVGGVVETGRAPLVVVADAAVVRFPESVDLDDPDPRLAIGCRLDGAVQVRGHDGLEVRGGNFRFDRESMTVVSNDPVQVNWAGHHGTADGVAIQLADTNRIHRAEKPDARDVAFGPVRTITMTRQVEWQLALDAADSVRGSTSRRAVGGRRWHVSCEGPLQMDLVQLKASLIGNVRVKKPAGHGGETKSDGEEPWDSLACGQLALMFRRPHQTWQTGEARLVLARLAASGSPVLVTSGEHDLEARARQVEYETSNGTMTLAGQVSARWQTGRLRCAHVSLGRGADGRIERARCRGAGEMSWEQVDRADRGAGQQTNGAGQVLARWSTGMTLKPDPSTGLDLVRLDGEPLVKHSADAALTANSISIWLTRSDVQGRRGSQSERVQVRRIVATDQVGAITPNAYVATERLDVSLRPVATGRRTGARKTRPRERGTEGQNQRPGQSVMPAVVRADQIEIKLGVPADGTPLVVEQVRTSGHVRWVRQGQTGVEPVELKGDEVRAVGRDGDAFKVIITGKPSHLRVGDRELVGRRVTLDTFTGHGEVQGAGTLAVPVDSRSEQSGLLADARPGRSGQKLLVRWDESLTVEGSNVSFLGDVKAELDGSRVDCQQLDLALSKTPRFSMEPGGWDQVSVTALRFRHAVRLTRYKREQVPVQPVSGSKAQPVKPLRLSAPLVQVTRARLANLVVDLVTGDLKGDGPGWLQVWERGERRKTPLGPIAVARANTPLELDAARWQYLRVDFARRAMGHIDDGFATFDDEVQAVMGFVGRPGDEVDPDQLGRDGGWLQCESLQVTRERPTGRAEGFATTLQATGDATFEGRNGEQAVYGRAETISFNQATDQVVLSSLGSQKATLWRRMRQGGSQVRLDAQRVIYNSRTQDVVLDRTSATQLLPPQSGPRFGSAARGKP